MEVIILLYIQNKQKNNAGGWPSPTFINTARISGTMAIKAFLAAAFVLLASNSGSVEELSPDNFQKKVLDNPEPAAVKFYARWCGPCRAMAPVFEDVCAEMEGRIYCGAYDTDQETDDGSSRYGASGVPTFAFYCHGELESRIMGMATKERLKQKMEQFAKSCD